MPFEFGDVVLVAFPFTSQSAFKQRPAVVVSKSGYNDFKPDLVLMPVTKVLLEVWINYWQAATLLKPSAIKPMFATLEQNLIRRRLGVLHNLDQIALRAAIFNVLG